MNFIFSSKICLVFKIISSYVLVFIQKGRLFTINITAEFAKELAHETWSAGRKQY